MDAIDLKGNLKLEDEMSAREFISVGAVSE